MNQAIIENLEALLEAVKAQPEKLFALDRWRIEADCGTMFCVAGLAASMPKFQALGLNWDRWDVPVFKGKDMWQDGGDELFGPKSMDELFLASGDGELDIQLGIDYDYDPYEDARAKMQCTDKELAIARLEHRINQYKKEI